LPGQSGATTGQLSTIRAYRRQGEKIAYLRDPDGNGVELYRDRPKEQWPRTPDGGLAMFTHPLDLDAMLKEA